MKILAARLRGLAAFMALIVLVAGSPAALVAWGRFDAATMLRPSRWLTPDDGTIFLGIATIVGWLAWTVFTVCVIAEAVGLATSQRHHVKLPGLTTVQGIAAGLLVASLTVLSPLTRSTVPPAAVPIVAAASAAPQPAEDVQTATESAEVDEKVMTVTVGPHDDLWKIAETWYGDGTSWRRIVAANPGIDVDHLTAGQELALPRVTMRVPTGHTGAGRPLDADELDQLAPSADSRDVHTVTVKEGDTLSGLAREWLGDASAWPSLWHANEGIIADPGHIEPGWKLIVPGSQATQAEPKQAESKQSAPAQPRSKQARTTQAQSRYAASSPAPIKAAVDELGEHDEAALEAGDTALDRGESGSEPHSISQPEQVMASAASGQDPAEILRTGLAGLSLFLAGGIAGTLASRRQQQLFIRPLGRRIPAVSGAPRRAKHILDTAADQRTCGDDNADSMTPTTVVLGTIDPRTPMLLDLADTGGLLGIDADAEVASAVVASISLSLVAAPWSGGIDIVAVGDDLAWLSRAGSDDVQCADADEVVEGLSGLADISRHPSITRVVLSSQPLDLPNPSSLAAAGIVVVMPSKRGCSVVVTDSHHAEVDGQAFTPQIVTTPMRRAVVELLETTARSDTEAAGWWEPRRGEDMSSPPTVMAETCTVSSDTHTTVEEEYVLTPTAPSDVARLPVPAGQVPFPVLRLLGPVDLVGARGNPPTKARRQCLEYCAWLLCHPGARSVQMADALMVAEPTRRSNVSRLRRWLGTDDDGQPYLPEGYDGSLRLAEVVSSDWERLELLVAGGIATAPLANLMSALDLVRGAPLADAAPGQWHWAEEWRIDMIQMIRDIGVEVARRAMDARDFDLAARALARATVACPEDEVLLVARIKLADELDDRGEVERLVYVLSRQARRLGVDLSEETISVLQEVMEGHVRARVV
ncbi:LysM peptidoglycan-binding domain-containing protein [Cutibacterium sp.]|uniref:LysM peptidoglycan-binding domain-containing protein n=1 Tax=Cutibacterium sp. TaxID=1912221 RepID=UPI0026DBFF16|nr:LysM peptidoglycan-binding domain-containing protein [Cutibacterium sp.]MDO4412583.1 LysM peptidoglycan-binding domain-containing protein [Cutibacterium sp.]